MEVIINSFLLVFVSEIGDKTQLLSLVLVARYRKPWTILLGVLIATIVNHALASWLGTIAAGLLSPVALKWTLAVTFFGFAGWILIPDKEGELRDSTGFGVLLTTIISFFLAEMGDKTQLATIALGARYANLTLVTIGSTSGMLASNAMAIFMGDKLLKRIPMKAVRMIAAVLFVAFGVGVILA